MKTHGFEDLLYDVLSKDDHDTFYIRGHINTKLNKNEKVSCPMKYYAIESDSYLAHHGVKGMHWGVRKYQNPDGSLTSAGKHHYIANPEGGYHVNGASKGGSKTSHPKSTSGTTAPKKNENKETNQDKDAAKARRKKIALITAGAVGAAAAGVGIAYGVKKYKSAANSLRGELEGYGHERMNTIAKQQSMLRKMEERSREKDWSWQKGTNIATKYMNSTTSQLNTERARSKGSTAIGRHLSDSMYDQLTEASHFGRKLSDRDIAKAIGHDTASKIKTAVGNKKQAIQNAARNAQQKAKQKADEANPLSKVKSDLSSYGKESADIARKQQSMLNKLDERSKEKDLSFKTASGVANKYLNKTNSERNTARSASKSKSNLTRLMSDSAYESLAQQAYYGGLNKNGNAKIAKAVASSAANQGKDYISNASSKGKDYVSNLYKTGSSMTKQIVSESVNNVKKKKRRSA